MISVGAADLKGLTKTVILLFIVVLATSSSGWVLASTEHVEVEFEGQATYQLQDNFLRVDGGVVINHGPVTIRGERLLVDLADNWIQVEGRAVLTLPVGEVAGEMLQYDLSTGMWSLIDAHASTVLPKFNAAVYLSGERFDCDDEQLVIVNGGATTCSLEHPHYYLAASKLEIYPDSHLIMRNVVYREGNTPLFYWPYLRVPITEQARLYLPKVGYTTAGGWFLGGEWDYKLSRFLSGQIRGQYHQLAGVVLGGTGAFSLAKPHQGQLLLEYKQNKLTGGGQWRGGLGSLFEYGPLVLSGNMERQMGFVGTTLNRDLLQADFSLSATAPKMSTNIGAVYRLTDTKTRTTEELSGNVELSSQTTDRLQAEGSVGRQTDYAGGQVSSNSLQGALALSIGAQTIFADVKTEYKLTERRISTTEQWSSNLGLSSKHLDNQFKLDGRLDEYTVYVAGSISSHMLLGRFDLKGETSRVSTTAKMNYRLTETQAKTTEQMTGSLEFSGRLDSRRITSYRGSYTSQQRGLPSARPDYQFVLTKDHNHYRVDLLWEQKLNVNTVTGTEEYVIKSPELSLLTNKLQYVADWPYMYTLKLGQYRVEPSGTKAGKAALELDLNNRPWQLSSSTSLVAGGMMDVSIYSTGDCHARVNPTVAWHWYPGSNLSMNTSLKLGQPVGETPFAFERISASQVLTSQVAYRGDRADWSLGGGYDFQTDRFQNLSASLKLRSSPAGNGGTLSLLGVFDPYGKRLVSLNSSVEKRIDHEQSINVRANYSFVKQRVDVFNAQVNIKWGEVYIQARSDIPKLKDTNLSLQLQSARQEPGWKVGLSGVFNPYINSLMSCTGLVEVKFTQEEGIRLGASYNVSKRRLDRFDAQVNVKLGDTSRLNYSGIYRGYEDKWYLGNLAVVKDLHCRELVFQYDQVENVFWLEYRILAFPQGRFKLGTTGEQFMFDAAGWEELLLQDD